MLGCRKITFRMVWLEVLVGLGWVFFPQTTKKEHFKHCISWYPNILYLEIDGDPSPYAPENQWIGVCDVQCWLPQGTQVTFTAMRRTQVPITSWRCSIYGWRRDFWGQFSEENRGWGHFVLLCQGKRQQQRPRHLLSGIHVPAVLEASQGWGLFWWTSILYDNFISHVPGREGKGRSPSFPP